MHVIPIMESSSAEVTVKRTRVTLASVCSVIAVILAAAALAVSLLHMGPAGPAGATGSQGPAGPTGPAGQDANSVYDKVCSTPDVLYNGKLITSYTPCTQVNPNG